MDGDPGHPGGGAMIVGVAVVELRVHGSRSLKAKRGVVRSIAGRLRNRFNVSVSEVGGQGTWQRAVLGLSMTGSEPAPLRRALEKAVAFVEQTHLAEVVASDIELLTLPLAGDDEVDAGPVEDALPWGEEGLADDGAGDVVGVEDACVLNGGDENDDGDEVVGPDPTGRRGE